MGIQPPAAPAAGPGAEPGRGASLAGRETYPAIRAQARREGGVVLWLDEMGVRADQAAGRSWAPVGQTPVIKGTGKRFRVNMISAISNAGRLRFRLFVGSFNGPVFIDFLRRLLRDCEGRKVHLIVDGHPVHHAKLVSAFIGRHADQIELHFLPGYSPELNPVELLNHDVKANAAGRRRPRSAHTPRSQTRSPREPPPRRRSTAPTPPSRAPAPTTRTPTPRGHAGEPLR